MPRQRALEQLSAGDGTGEPRGHDGRCKQTTSDDSNEKDDDQREGHRGNAHRAEDVVVVLDDGTPHHVSAEICCIVDRVPPSRVHQGKVASGKQHRAHDRTPKQPANWMNHAKNCR